MWETIGVILLVGGLLAAEIVFTQLSIHLGWYDRADMEAIVQHQFFMEGM